MTLKARLDSGQDTTILFAGDSLTPNSTSGYVYNIGEKLGYLYPNARVLFKSRNAAGVPSPTVTTVIQAGTGCPTITLIRDGDPGKTSLQRLSQMSAIYAEQAHVVSIFLGTNDAVNFGSPGYSPQDYLDNMTQLANYPKQEWCADVVLITPIWTESSFGMITAGYAALVRLLGRRLGVKVCDGRRVFEDHYVYNSTYHGQGNWFDGYADNTHFNWRGHYALADEWLCTMGLSPA